MRTSLEFDQRERSVRADPAVPPSTDNGCRLPLLSIILLRINGLRVLLGTARCLGSGRDVCVMKQDEGMDLSFFVFDILQLDGHDVRGKSLGARKVLLKRYLSFTGNVEIVLGDEPTYEQHTKNFDQYLEGSVLKDIRSAYAGRRHNSWRKWKEIEEVDARIIGYKEGQGKFLGLIGAIQFRAEDGTVGYCSGMDDETRIWISDRRDTLLGKTIEIAHYGKLVDGFRHPQFKRFREDKI